MTQFLQQRGKEYSQLQLVALTAFLADITLTFRNFNVDLQQDHRTTNICEASLSEINSFLDVF